MIMPADTPLAIRLHRDDNVVIALADLAAGTTVPGLTTPLPGSVPRGHKIATRVPNTSANSILITKDGFAGAADTRTRGAVAVGY